MKSKSRILLISNKHLNLSFRDMMSDDASVVLLESLKEAELYVTDHWDCIFLDADMAEKRLDSFSFLLHSKIANPINEYIVFSCSNDVSKCMKAMRYGASNYVVVPFERRMVLSLIQSVKAENLQLDHLVGDLAHSYFVDVLEDKKILLKELIFLRRLEGRFVDGKEFLAFFPPHERHDAMKIDDLRKVLGDVDFENLQKVAPPKILLVEDEKNVRSAVSDVLIDFGYDVYEAENAHEAVSVANELSSIDLFLLDIGLPGTNGIDLIPVLRDIHPSAETIMLTAFKNQMDFVVKSFKQHVYDYITKPFDKDDLLIKISKALQKKSFGMLMDDLGSLLLDEKLTLWTKYKILEEISQKRKSVGRSLKMKDIYLFFPELRISELQKTVSIPDQIIEDGVLLFIELMMQKVETGLTGEDLLLSLNLESSESENTI